MLSKGLQMAALGIAVAATSVLYAQEREQPRAREPAVQDRDQPRAREAAPQDREQPRREPAAEEQSQENSQPAQAYRVKQVLGSKVSIEGNMAIGTVDDLVFDDYGRVEYLIVLNEGKLVTVPWEAAKFNFQQRTAVINITPQQYRQVPTYTADQYPSYFASPYRTQIYGYYGLTPRQQRIERKLERRL